MLMAGNNTSVHGKNLWLGQIGTLKKIVVTLVYLHFCYNNTIKWRIQIIYVTITK